MIISLINQDAFFSITSVLCVATCSGGFLGPIILAFEIITKNDVKSSSALNPKIKLPFRTKKHEIFHCTITERRRCLIYPFWGTLYLKTFPFPVIKNSPSPRILVCKEGQNG